MTVAINNMTLSATFTGPLAQGVWTVNNGIYDEIFGNGSNDLLNGDDGDDLIIDNGFQTISVLNGGAGNDLLISFI